MREREASWGLFYTWLLPVKLANPTSVWVPSERSFTSRTRVKPQCYAELFFALRSSSSNPDVQTIRIAKGEVREK